MFIYMCNTGNYLENNSVNSWNPWNPLDLIFVDNSRNPRVRNPHNSRNSVHNPWIKILTPVDNWAGISL